MKSPFSLSFLALCFTLFSSPTYALEGGPILGPNWSSLEASRSGGGTVTSYSSERGFGIGGALSQEFMQTFSFEVDALYKSINYSYDKTEINQRMFQIQPVISYWILGFVGIGAGPFFSFYTGDVTATTTLTDGTKRETTQTYEAATTETSDYGANLVGSVKIPVPGLFSLQGSLRYQFGFADLDKNPGMTSHSRNLDFLVSALFPL